MLQPASHFKVFLAVFGALLLLVAATVAAAQFDLGPGNLVLALGIAATKAALILWFFMHLRESSNFTRIFAAAGLAWLAILLTLSLADFWTRP